jgi:hypothetical protein
MQVLNELLPARVISRSGLQHRPISTPATSFYGGYLKSKVYEKKLRKAVELKQNIRVKVAAISPTMLQRVMQKFQKSLGELVENKRRYLRHIQDVNIVTKNALR